MVSFFWLFNVKVIGCLHCDLRAPSRITYRRNAAQNICVGSAVVTNTIVESSMVGRG
jgi:hypothetical protein